MTIKERKANLVRLSTRLIQCHELAHGDDRLITDEEIIALDETIASMPDDVTDDGGGKVVEETQIL